MRTKNFGGELLFSKSIVAAKNKMFGRQLEALCERAYDQAQMLKKTVSIRF
jgi:hypothetical protein